MFFKKSITWFGILGFGAIGGGTTGRRLEAENVVVFDDENGDKGWDKLDIDEDA